MYGLLAVFTVTLISAALEGEQPAPSVMYQYDFTTSLDTITDTGSATFTIPASLHSKWQAGWFFDATQLSGTTDLTCAIQEQGFADGSWIQVDTIDLDGTSAGKVTIASVYGKGQRCVCTGSGTQSTQIDVYAIFKKD